MCVKLLFLTACFFGSRPTPFLYKLVRHFSAVRSRRSSNLIFASYVCYCDRSCFCAYPQLASLTLAELSVILLPIDAANNSGNVECNESWSGMFCGSLDMAGAWYTVFMLIFIFALFIVPFTIFFYEEDDSLALT